MFRSTWFFFLMVCLAFSAHAAEPPRILILGDSLSAGFGVAAHEAWPHLLQQRLSERALPYQVVNASISGDTTAGGRNRLPAALERHHPVLVIIELGANDGLRGLPLEHTRSNLEAMIALCHKKQAKVLLAGMRLPPNYGPIYGKKFTAIFHDLAKSSSAVHLIPFLLHEVGGVAALNLPDGIHPNPEGHRRVLENVWQELAPMLTKETKEKKTSNQNKSTGNKETNDSAASHSSAPISPDNG